MQDYREQDHQTQSTQLLRVGASGEVMGLPEVEDEVGRRVDQLREQGDLHEAPLEQYRRGHQQHRQGEVERAAVPDQVLVVTT